MNMQKIVVILALLLLVAAGLINLGMIGAGMSFDEINQDAFLIKNLFLGFMKVAPLILIVGVIILLAKEVNDG